MIIYPKFFFPIVSISNKFNLPYDISIIIYKFFLNSTANIIIKNWFSYIYIHNIHLCDIVNRLSIHCEYDIYGDPFFFYDLNDKNIGITFNICYKFLHMNISYFTWWKNILQYAFNGISMVQSFNHIVNFNCNSINKFNHKFFISWFSLKVILHFIFNFLFLSFIFYFFMYHLLSIINKDVFFHIQSFIFNFSANTIRFYWLKFFSYKSFIIDCIFNLPLIHSSFDNDFIYDITHPFTLFFFKKLSKLINGREKSFKLIYYFYYTLALSIDDYEWSYGFFNYSYHFNRIICLSISQFFNWNHIIHILK